MNPIKCQRIAVYAVVCDQHGRILLTRTSVRSSMPGRWFLPGGGVDHGEEPVYALQRELREETGYHVTVGPLLHIFSDVDKVRNNHQLHTIRLVFRAEVVGGTLQPEVDGTTDHVAWFTLEDAFALPLVSFVESALRALPPSE